MVEPPPVSVLEAENIRVLLAERARRSIESLRLYEPLPSQLRFHASLSPERLIRGGNRGGKTLPAAVEVARAVTGCDPYGKYPKTDGRCFCIGKDGRHLGQVMARKLFRATAFKIIRDQDSGLWRAFRPLDQRDQARANQWKWAPPLIPQRFIKSTAWENKKEGQPSLVTLHNGWEISFFSSLGKPPNGNDIDLCWFDEEIVDPEWYPEMSARLLDRRGRFIWSATPQAGTEQLFALHERADEERGAELPKVSEHLILLADNPHIDEEQKKEFAAKLSEMDYAVRIEGDFALLSFKVYPEFSPEVHFVPWFEISKTWTRYAVVDPGRQVCAVLFAAVPPPDHGDRIYVYDELYIRNCDAELFGKGMRDKTMGQIFRAFIIDHQGGRVHDAAVGISLEMHYAAALKKYKVMSQTTGYNFVWGDSNIEAGLEAVRGLLRVREDGKPKLLIVPDRCPNLIWEFKHYRYKRIKDQVLDKPEDRGRVHQMACLRYLALYPTRYHARTGKGHVGGAITAFRKKQKRQREAAGGSFVRLGPGK